MQRLAIVGSRVLLCLAVGMTPRSALAQAPVQPPPTTSPPPDFLTQPQLLGDMWGVRTAARENLGTTFGFDVTQFFGWVPIGTDDRDSQYGLKFDARAHTDLSAWTWKGLTVDGSVTLRAGEAPLASSGTFIPTSAAMMFPRSTGAHIRLNGLSFTQVLNPHVSVSAGRYYTIELYNRGRLYLGGRGIDRFMNMSFVDPPLPMRTTPPVVEGVLFTITNGTETIANLGLIESTDPGFFANGATFVWRVTPPIELVWGPGRWSVGGTFSSTVVGSHNPTPYAFIPQTDPAPAPEHGAWTLNVTVEQAFAADDANPAKTVGLFGMLGFSDGNPTAFQPFFFAGAGGSTYPMRRSNDTFGIGYFAGGLSGSFIDSFAPPLSLRNERGLELFYNASLTGWTQLSADLQFVHPFESSLDTRTFFTLRWKIAF